MLFYYDGFGIPLFVIPASEARRESSKPFNLLRAGFRTSRNDMLFYYDGFGIPLFVIPASEARRESRKPFNLLRAGFRTRR